MSKRNKKGYLFYACLKDGHSGGIILTGRNTCEEAYADLKRLEMYVQNDIKFIGVIKSKTENPLSLIEN